MFQNMNLPQQVSSFIPGPHLIQPENLQISKVVFAQTRKYGYGDQVSRPYSLNITPEYINNIANTVAPFGRLHTVNPVDLQKACGGMLSYNAALGLQANIENGWREERFLFLITATYSIGHMDFITYLQGYTDHGQMSYSGLLDPNMILHINSICTVSKNLDPISGRVIVNNIEYYNVLKNVLGETTYQEMDMYNFDIAGSSIKKCIRPLDIVNNIFLLEDNRYSNGVVCEYSGDLKPNDTISSAKDNNNPLTYLTKTLNSLVSAEEYNAVGVPSTPNILRTASTFLDEAQYSRNAMLLFIFGLTQDIGDMTSFSYRTIQPFIQHTPTLIDNKDVFSIGITGATDVAYNQSITPESIKSYALAMQLSSIMAKYMVTGIQCSIANVTGAPIIPYLKLNTYIEEIDLNSIYNKISNEIMLNIVPMLTDNGYTMVQCHIDCDLFYDITISIAIGSNPEILHRYPIFADSIINPMLGDEHAKRSLTSGFNAIVDTIVTNTADLQIENNIHNRSDLAWH